MTDPLADGLDPSPREAEQSVLSAMLRDNSCIPDVTLALSAADFASDAHQKVYSAIRSRGGLPVDLVLLCDALRLAGHLEDCGGPPYLAELWDAAPSSANATHYAALVRDAALRRSLARVAHAVLRDCAAPIGPAAEAVAAAERALAALAGRARPDTTSTLAEAVDAVLARIEAAEAARQAGAASAGLLQTGLAPLDLLLGGLQAGNLVIVAARPSVGKSAVAVALALNIARSAGCVLVASLEMCREELATRVLSAESGVEGRFIRAAELNGVAAEALFAARDSLRPVPLVFDDAPRQSLAHIGAACRRLQRLRGLACVFVDYLQLVEPEDRRANRNAQVGAVSRGLKALARELGVPVFALAQLNRKSEERADKRPELSDLRDSGEIEQDGDVVVLLHRPADRPAELEFLVRKNRNGRDGDVAARFDRARMRLGDAGRGDEGEVF